MKTAVQTFAIAFASVTAAAALGVTLADHTAAPVPLERSPFAPPVAASEVPVAVVARVPRLVVESQRQPTVPQALAQNRHARPTAL